MARPIFDTANTSTSNVAVQLYTSDSLARMFAMSVKARVGNGGNMYFGYSSSASSASGWELLPGKGKSFTFSDVLSSQPNKAATVKATSAWVNAASTTDKLDWDILLEN